MRAPSPLVAFALLLFLVSGGLHASHGLLHRYQHGDERRCAGRTLSSGKNGSAEAGLITDLLSAPLDECSPWWMRSLAARGGRYVPRSSDGSLQNSVERSSAARRERRSSSSPGGGTGLPADYNAWSNGVVTSATLPGDIDNIEDGDQSRSLYAAMDVVQFQAARNGSLSECILLYMVSEYGVISRTWLYQVQISTWFTLDARMPDAEAAGMKVSPSPFGGKRQWPGVAVAHVDGAEDDDYIDTVLIFGGATFSFDIFNDTWHLNDFQWRKVKTSENHVGLGRMRHSATTQVIKQGDRHMARFFIYGGLRQGEIMPLVFLNDVWVLDIDDITQANQTGTWTEITPNASSPIPVGRAHAFVQRSNDNKLIMFGGWSVNLTTPSAPNIVHRDLWELDLEQNTWVSKGGVHDKCTLTTNNQSPSVTPPASYIPDLDIVVVYTMDCSDEPIHRESALLHVFDRRTQLWSEVKPKVAYDLVPYLSMHPAETYHGTEITFLMRRASQDTGEFLFVPFQISFSQCSCDPADNTSVVPSATLNSVVVQLGTPPQFLPQYTSICAVPRSGGADGNLVFVIGGYQGNYTLKDLNAQSLEVTRKHGLSTWLFHHSEKTWSKVQPDPAPSQRAGFTLVHGGNSLYMFAGYFIVVPDVSVVAEVTMYADLWCFNFTSMEWTESTPPNAPEQAVRQRLYHSAVMDTEQGRMVIFGGFDQTSERIRSDILTWVPTDGRKCEGTFHAHHKRGAPRLVGHTATLIAGIMYVFGGITEDSSSTSGKALLRSFYKVDAVDLEWTDLSPRAPAGRVFHSASAIGNKLVIVGGCSKQNFAHWTQQAPYYYFTNLCLDGSQIDVNAILVFDTPTELWSTVSAENSPGSIFQHAAFVDDRRIHMLGGNLNSKTEVNILAAGLFNIEPSCPAGHYTVNFTTDPCYLCSDTTYSSKPGATSCLECNGKTYTGILGATSIQNCSKCVAGVCNGHGTCSVLDTGGTVSCACEFGFVPTDNCLIPVYYLLMAFVILLQIILVTSVYSMRLYNRRKNAEYTKARQLRISRKEVSDLASAWEISSDEIMLKRRIDLDSPGGFGEVWLAEYRDMLVAVKKLHQHLHNAELRQEFEREVETLRRIRHPNIVLFLGTGTEKASELPFIVLEYMQRGTLYNVLSARQVNIDHVQRLRFALDAARGMRFLHNLKPPRIHRDLKSANLLVSERWVVKVSDFGAARTIPNIGQALEMERQPMPSNTSMLSSTSTSIVGSTGNTPPKPAPPLSHVKVSWPATLSRQKKHSTKSTLPRRSTEDEPLLKSWAHLSTEVGTFAWSSPELLQRKAYGSSTDVYSFGIVCWELFTREEPFSEFADCRMISDLVGAIVSNRRPTIPADCPGSYRSLVEECWSADYASRPTFEQLVPRLDNLLENWASQDFNNVQVHPTVAAEASSSHSAPTPLHHNVQISSRV